MSSPALRVAPLKIFVVDNGEVVIRGLADIIDNTPEQDLEMVGSDTTFASDLPEVLRRVKADTVVVDIRKHDQEHDETGVGLIRSIRRALGPEIGIVVFTAFEDSVVRAHSLDAGADYWIPKGATNNQIRAALRGCKNHETLSSIRLGLSSREITVGISHTNNRKQDVKITPGRGAFALVYYLAEERARNEVGWLKKASADGKDLPYQFAQGRLWAKTCERFHTKEADRWDNNEVARQAAVINPAVRVALPLNQDLNLIITPGVGRRAAGAPSMYCLNEFIAPSAVCFDGDRICP